VPASHHELLEELLRSCTFAPAPAHVVCAVSGGADSTALVALATAAGLQVTAIHVDHGQRTDSADEASIVAANALRLGASFEARRVEVAPGPNLEARLREARYGALPDGTLTGHTADDQAETVLLNLLRGAASRGLAAMTPDSRRPLLRLRRADTAALCRELGLPTIDDPSNTDPAIRRNRVRREVVPLLNDVASRDVVPVLTRQADLFRADDALLEELASTIDPADACAVAKAPEALARRAIRRWLTVTHPPDLASVDRVLDVARGAATACEVSGGRRVSRHGQRLRLHDR
jgi:tRNA(Ile)-lysidine synthase